MKKIGVITQARFGSTRLPGKILLPVNGKELLRYHLDRLKQTGFEVVVATSTLPQEQPILDLCAELDVPVVRGSETDVLSRFHEVWKTFGFETMVRVTSDCPLIDPLLIREGIAERERLQTESCERIYYSNTIDRTYARGFDFEIFDQAMLQEAMKEAKTPSEWEHVTPYFYLQRSPGIKMVQKKQEVDHSSLRITVDEQADFDLVERLIIEFQAQDLDHRQIEEILMNREDLRSINREIEQKKA